MKGKNKVFFSVCSLWSPVLLINEGSSLISKVSGIRWVIFLPNLYWADKCHVESLVPQFKSMISAGHSGFILKGSL